ncbi:MAG: cell division protein FtsA, partial [Chitinophagales bacterium]
MKQSQNMNPENIIVGLDIGTTKICCIVAKKNENQKIEILGTGIVPSRGVRDGEVDNIQDTTEDIMVACQKAKDKTGIEFKEVFVG